MRCQMKKYVKSHIFYFNILENVCEAVQNKGFTNYFGLQRFGVNTVNTSDLGRLALQGKYFECITSIITEKPYKENYEEYDTDLKLK